MNLGRISIVCCAVVGVAAVVIEITLANGWPEYVAYSNAGIAAFLTLVVTLIVMSVRMPGHWNARLRLRQDSYYTGSSGRKSEVSYGGRRSVPRKPEA
jgi:hypothetical protein